MQRLLDNNAGNRVEGARMPKIPLFIQTDPELWFLQVEATFRNSNYSRLHQGRLSLPVTWC